MARLLLVSFAALLVASVGADDFYLGYNKNCYGSESTYSLASKFFPNVDRILTGGSSGTATGCRYAAVHFYAYDSWLVMVLSSECGADGFSIYAGSEYEGRAFMDSLAAVRDSWGAVYGVVSGAWPYLVSSEGAGACVDGDSQGEYCNGDLRQDFTFNGIALDLHDVPEEDLEDLEPSCGTPVYGSEDDEDEAPIGLIIGVAAAVVVLIVVVAVVGYMCKKNSAPPAAAPPMVQQQQMVMQPAVQMAQPVAAPHTFGNRFDTETGAPIPQFDPNTGKQNW